MIIVHFLEIECYIKSTTYNAFFRVTNKLLELHHRIFSNLSDRALARKIVS